MWPQSQFVFTLPGCGFVVALNLDWCPDADQAIVNGESNNILASTFSKQETHPHIQAPLRGRKPNCVATSFDSGNAGRCVMRSRF